jgi:hypothetical protein
MDYTHKYRRQRNQHYTQSTWVGIARIYESIGNSHHIRLWTDQSILILLTLQNLFEAYDVCPAVPEPKSPGRMPG